MKSEVGDLRLKRGAMKLTAVAVAMAYPGVASPERLTTIHTNTFGTPSGLIDMPTAEMAPDGQLSTTGAYFDGNRRVSLSFQILPRLSGTFRIIGIDDFLGSSLYYDRSFDLRFQLFDETQYTPAVAIGLQDFVGTGLLGSEYIVATKSVGDRLRLTGGVGWGRLGSYKSIGSTGSRPGFDSAQSEGGEFSVDDWFRGDYALFGGASFDLTEQFTFSLEYSSDAYVQEVNEGVFRHKSPWNFGLTYKPSEDFHLSLYSVGGSEIGARINLTLNPKNAPAPGGAELASVPVAVRPAGSALDLGWTMEPENYQIVSDSIQRGLDREDLDLDGIRLDANTAHIRIRNDRYDAQSQALGRSLRVLSRSLPPSIETLRVTLMTNGIPASTLTFNRSDLERLEHAPASEALAAAQFGDTLRYADFPEALDGAYPRFNWWVEPYVKTVFFDAEEPILADAGIRARARFNFGSGWIASGSVSQVIGGNLDKARTIDDSIVPFVRTQQAKYLDNDNPVIDQLTLAKFMRPAPDFYGRVTMGYLETAYAGVSAELLWKPVDSRLALGIEANYVQPRDFDQLFKLRSRNTPGGTIPRASGHVSAYYDLGFGFHTQVDVGRYLAGDWGATLSIDREFANGWRVGGFMTQTEFSSREFGNGSFDKGIRFQIPLAWAVGTPTRKTTGMELRPFLRDGGARLRVEDRLYDVLRDSHSPEVAKSWGKFWR